MSTKIFEGKRARIAKLRDREFAIRDATWMLEGYLETGAIELLGGLASGD